MNFISWMYDIARDQAPTEDGLVDLLTQSAAAGYNAVGLYLEHRFAYRSAPWAAAPGVVTPEIIQRVLQRIRAAKSPAAPRVIPFLNTLGHMEGFIRSQDGWYLGETHEVGRLSLQICPSRTECIDFARNLVRNAMETFDDEWVHIGGDEAYELGNCPKCKERVAKSGKAGLFGEYYGDLCRWVIKQGRRPCVWGDMLLEHPEAMDHLPRETVIFDWQYFNRPRVSTRRLRDKGFDVVCSPSIQTYNSIWGFLRDTQDNIDQHAEDSRELGALGLCVTTWEFTFFTQFRTALPLVLAAGRRLSRSEDWSTAIRAVAGDEFLRAIEILGEKIPRSSDFIKPGTWRPIRDRMVLRQNPFYLWKDWHADACGPAGDTILRMCDDVDRILPPDHILRFPCELYRVAVEWVRAAQAAYIEYGRRNLSGAITHLERGAAALARLEPGLVAVAAQNVGGARVDVFRIRALVEKVRTVCRRISELESAGVYRAGQLYLPAFETISHDAYIHHDYAGWRTGMYR